MENEKSYESLLKLGFVPEQIERLRQARCVYVERERRQMATEQHRLEFARWLVSTGRLTDDILEIRTF